MPELNRILIAGASVAAGYKLPDEKNNTGLFVTRAAVELLGYQHSDINNISIVGIDNDQIFLDSAIELSTGKYQHAIVCWGSMPRINYNFGLETYSTVCPLICLNDGFFDINLVAGQKVPAEKIRQVRQLLLRHYNLHWDILKLVKYVNVLRGIAQQHSTELLFVNYSIPWGENRYFDQIDYSVPSDLDEFTRQILDVDLRDDSEVRQLYQQIHSQYMQAGGINEPYWINLYEPLRAIQVDNAAPDDAHPGTKSQAVFFDYIKSKLQQTTIQ